MAKDPCARTRLPWIRVRNRKAPPRSLDRSGKWLLYIHCPWIDGVWSRVVADVRAGLLGPDAKVSTHLPSPLARGPGQHVVCVYTADALDEDDVLRVARRLVKTADLKRKTISYKTDAQTLAGEYAAGQGAPLALYSFKPPYAVLTRPQVAVRVPRRSRPVRMTPSPDQRLRRAVDAFSLALRERVERGELTEQQLLAAVAKYENAMRPRFE